MTLPGWFDRTELGAIFEVGANRQLITQGHRTSRFIMILKGHVSIRIGRFDVESIGPGDYFGEIGLLDRLNGGPGIAVASATTSSDATIRSLAPWEFGQLVAAEPQVRMQLERNATARLLLLPDFAIGQ